MTMYHRSCAACGQAKEAWSSLAPVFVCCECPGQVELCLRCFVRHAEPGEHSRRHSYRIRSGREELLAPGWAAAEELCLLSALGEKGFGNWVDAAQLVPRKTAAEVEDHYWAEYACRFGVDVPRRLRCPRTGAWEDVEAFDVKWTDVEDEGAASMFSSKVVVPPPTVTSSEEPWTVGGDPLMMMKLDESLLAGVPPRKAVPCETSFRNVYPGDKMSDGFFRLRERPARGTRCAPVRFTATLSDAELSASRADLCGAELAGFMPLRGDFDVEHDNGAEMLVADMDFRDDDSASDRLLKRRVLEMYVARLDDREARKRFVIDRGLLDARRERALDARLAADERALVAQVRAFARYQAPEAHDAWVRGLLHSLRLRKRIAHLERAKALGLRTLADVHRADQDRADIDADLRHKRRKHKEDLRYGLIKNINNNASSKNQENNAIAADREKALDARHHSINARDHRANQCVPAPPPVTTAAATRMDVDGLENNNNNFINNNNNNNTTTNGPPRLTEEAPSTAAPSSSSSSSDEEHEDVDAAPPRGGDPAPENGEGSQRAAVGLLSAADVAEARKLDLAPADFVEIKHALGTHAATRPGALSRDRARRLFKVESAKADRLYDLAVRSGWISTRADDPCWAQRKAA